MYAAFASAVLKCRVSSDVMGPAADLLCATSHFSVKIFLLWNLICSGLLRWMSESVSKSVNGWVSAQKRDGWSSNECM